MKRSLLLTFLLVGLTAAACSKSSSNRLTDGGPVTNIDAPVNAPPSNPGTHNPADPGVPGDPGNAPNTAPVAESTSPVAEATPNPALSRFETYAFDGFVIEDGSYYGTVSSGTAVSGTFRIDFNQPVAATAGNVLVYRAFDSMQGTVGEYAFSAGQDYLYVNPDSRTAFFVDTAFLLLDNKPMTFDFFFFLADDQAQFPDGSLENLRSLDQRHYRRVVLWFETDAPTGKGFNVDLFSIRRIDTSEVNNPA